MRPFRLHMEANLLHGRCCGSAAACIPMQAVKHGKAGICHSVKARGGVAGGALGAVAGHGVAVVHHGRRGLSRLPVGCDGRSRARRARCCAPCQKTPWAGEAAQGDIDIMCLPSPFGGEAMERANYHIHQCLDVRAVYKAEAGYTCQGNLHVLALE